MYKYIIDNIEQIATDIVSLRLRAKSDADIFKYSPGQYAAISFISNGTASPLRCFSFVSSPTTKGIIEFGFKIGGAFTEKLASLKPGDEIDVMGPFGEFVLDPRRVNRAVFMAGGIGITPFISMIRTASELNWPIKMTLLYSVRRLEDAAYIQELNNIQKINPNFELITFVTKEDISEHKSDMLVGGQITPELLNQIVKGKYNDKTFFLCGPSAFMTAMRNNLIMQGVYYNKIISEEFSSTVSSNLLKPSLQKKVNLYVLSGMIGLLLFVVAVDASKTIAKLNATATNSAAEESTLFPSENSATPTTPTDTSSSTPSNSSSTSSNTNVQSTPNTSSQTGGYTTPMTRMS